MTSTMIETTSRNATSADVRPPASMFPGRVVAYRGSLQDFHGLAWADRWDDICEECERAGGRRLQGSCLAVLTTDGEWGWLHNVHEGHYR